MSVPKAWHVARYSRSNRAERGCRPGPSTSAQTTTDMPSRKPWNQSRRSFACQSTSSAPVVATPPAPTGTQLDAPVALEEVAPEPQVGPRRAPVGGHPELRLRPAVPELLDEEPAEGLEDAVGVLIGVLHRRDGRAAGRASTACRRAPPRARRGRRRCAARRRRRPSRRVAVLARDVDRCPRTPEHLPPLDLDELGLRVRREVVLHAVLEVRPDDPRSGHVRVLRLRVQHLHVELVGGEVVARYVGRADPQARSPVGEQAPGTGRRRAASWTVGLAVDAAVHRRPRTGADEAEDLVVATGRRPVPAVG